MNSSLSESFELGVRKVELRSTDSRGAVPTQVFPEVSALPKTARFSVFFLLICV